MKPIPFLLLVFAVGGCAVRQGESGAVETAHSVEPSGWYDVAGHPCYRPPNFDALSGAGRRQARGDALYEVTRRWRGSVDPDFLVPDDLADTLESLVLQHPDLIERLVVEDHDLCTRWARGQITQEDYARSLGSVQEEFQAGTCAHPSFELVTQYLEVDRRWQFDLPLCKGDRVDLKASSGYYTIAYQGDDEKTSWITAEGDRTRPTVGTDYPCAEEGCFAGQLVGRFQDREGHSWVFPVGFGTRFVAPAHGSLSFSINDIEMFDNRFRVVDGVKDFLLVEIRPAEGP